MLISTGPCPFCNSGNNTPCFATYDDGYHCFTCGKTKRGSNHFAAWFPNNTRNSEFYIPEHTGNPRQFSPKALGWLYDKYVFDDLIRKHGLFYVPSTESLGMPVFDDEGKMVFCQLRKDEPKRFITKGSKDNMFIAGDGSNTVVFVEDYISAIRVGEHVDTVCLFGTTMSLSNIERIVDTYSNFVIWLDGDEAGRKASDALEYRLIDVLMKKSLRYAWSCNTVKNVSTRTTDLDPKCYTDSEIKNIIGE